MTEIVTENFFFTFSNSCADLCTLGAACKILRYSKWDAGVFDISRQLGFLEYLDLV